ncbi:MAG: LON peptidase substrate-binding domain-containing protein [Steroidobacteraceae bacterium]
MSVLALFPLRTVLFPGGLLPLRIFEPRYLDMVGRVMRDGSPFGVVQLLEGGETGAVTDLEDVGSSARIVDFQTMADGLLGVLCRGERRFRILSREQQSDGLHVAEVEWLHEPRRVPLPEAQQPLARLLRRALEAQGERVQFLQADYQSCGWVVDRLAELLPLEGRQRQQLLETEDPHERLMALLPLLRLVADED